jgi:hypothetical protein
MPAMAFADEDFIKKLQKEKAMGEQWGLTKE